MFGSATWALILVVTLAGGEPKRTVLADPPFTNLSACAVAAGIFYRQGIGDLLPKGDVTWAAYMRCVRN